jgi:metal-responsive CopG/Arc/MetJ family transcriptional regulator
MKTIQITVDEDLLTRLDADEETKRTGRSAVFRRAVEAYLQRRRRAGITDSYRRGYGKKKAALDYGFDTWENEGVWPSE